MTDALKEFPTRPVRLGPVNGPTVLTRDVGAYYFGVTRVKSNKQQFATGLSQERHAGHTKVSSRRDGEDNCQPS